VEQVLGQRSDDVGTVLRGMQQICKQGIGRTPCRTSPMTIRMQSPKTAVPWYPSWQRAGLLFLEAVSYVIESRVFQRLTKMLFGSNRW
jgi:hypothetical protein